MGVGNFVFLYVATFPICIILLTPVKTTIFLPTVIINFILFNVIVLD